MVITWHAILERPQSLIPSWYFLCSRFSLSWISSIILHQTYISLTDVLTCLLNLILFAISIHTPKISRQSFRYVTFGDEQTVHLTLSLKKGKCMVFKPRQVQDVRIVKFKEILVITIMIVRVQRRHFFFWIPTPWTSRNWNFATRLVILFFFFS